MKTDLAIKNINEKNEVLMKNLLSLFIVLCFAYNSVVFAQSFTADDFLPPAEADTEASEEELRTVADPSAVAEETSPITGEPAVKANTQQDAINAFINERSSGFKEFIFPSGFGFAAMGSAPYQIHESNVTTRIDKRNA
jgi:hypothetical protein